MVVCGILFGGIHHVVFISMMCMWIETFPVSVIPQMLLWDFIWWYAPCRIYIHDVYVDWNIPCINYSLKCYYGRLWDFI